MSSTKVTIASGVLSKTEVWIKGGEKINSPSKRSVLGDLENLLPSSPDLLLSVPETPNSQIRLSSPGEEAACGFKVGQLSPVCRSPSSKGPKLRHVLTKTGERTKKEHRLSGPLKRLFSPPEKSHSAKRVRSSPPKHVISSTVGSLKVVKPLADPVKTPQLCSDPPDGPSESLVGPSRGKTEDLTTSRKAAIPHSTDEQRKEEEENAECDFTVITELKAAEAQISRDLQRCPDEDISTVTACAQTARCGSGEEHVLKGKETTKTLETNGDGGSNTSSDQEQTTGMPCHRADILGFDCCA